MFLPPSSSNYNLIHTGRVSVSKRDAPFMVRLGLKEVSVGENKSFYYAMLHLEKKSIKRQK
jgi:hypothetical protein